MGDYDLLNESAIADKASRMIFLHIGYHKTGTTFLQKNIFRDSKYGFIRLKNDRKIIHKYFTSQNSYYLIPNEIRRSFYAEAEEAAKAGLTLVISHERLVGYPPSGGHDSKLIADRLKDVFPNALVLIVIREQISIIKSIYSQYITDGGDLTLKRFLCRPQKNIHRVPYFDFEFYEYHTLIHYYQCLFGKDRVLALTFEYMLTELDGFVKRIFDFNNLAEPILHYHRPLNTKRPILVQFFRRYINRFLTRNQLSNNGIINIPYIDRGFDVAQPFFQAIMLNYIENFFDMKRYRYIAGIVQNRYRSSNRMTSEAIGMDLCKFGYDC